MAVGATVGVGVGWEVVGVGVIVGVGVSAKIISVKEIFWGLGFSRMMKSLLLLSVSSLLPWVASLPEVMDSTVDVDNALRSRLWVVLGLALLLASKSAAVPIPTLSTRRGVSELS